MQLTRVRYLTLGVISFVLITAVLANASEPARPRGHARVAKAKARARARVHHRSKPDTTVTVGQPTAAPPIPASFTGVSMEYSSIARVAGSPKAPNGVFVALLRALAPHQQPVLRIGGNSTDGTWAPVRRRFIRGLNFAITPAWLADVRGLVDRLHPQLTVGINLAADSVPLAHAEARALYHTLGARRINYFELGNEPELYGWRAWYRIRGAKVRARPAGFDFQQYMDDYNRTLRRMPKLPLAGPAADITSPWNPDLATMLNHEPRLRQVTYHAYPTNCYDTSGPRQPSIANLLAQSASRGLAAKIKPVADLARGYGRTLRIDELNSVACGGRPGISDTYASALWSVDTLFALARVGVSGVDIHTFDHAYYKLFGFRHDRKWLAHVFPLYYGLLTFERGAPAGSRMLATRESGRRRVRSWATRLGNTTRVTLINDSGRRVSTALRV
ncbi:MAG: hypothetical protein J2O48_11270, partial [Solirubrobacterales bacterium]|nr:hypothetical protein [Solirubrobacterales bacterium]